MLLGKKKSIDVQFFTEVGEIVTNLDKYHHQMDSDDVYLEQVCHIRVSVAHFCREHTAVRTRATSQGESGVQDILRASRASGEQDNRVRHALSRSRLSWRILALQCTTTADNQLPRLARGVGVLMFVPVNVTQCVL